MPVEAQSPNTPNIPDAKFDVGPYFSMLRISDYSRPSPFDDIKRENTWSLLLPVPTELREDSPTDWATPNMMSVGDLQNGDLAGGAVAAVLRNTGNLVSAAGEMAGGIANKFLPAKIQASGAMGALGKTLGDLFPPENITTAVQQYFGVAPNPNQTVAFQGPQLRSFSFSWTFNPRNKEESRNYQKIIKKLRSRSLPTLAIGGSNAVLKYPSMVQMNLYPWDSMGESIPGSSARYGWTSESIIKMKTCVISNVSVNYAPGNIPAFFEGTRLPTVIQLSISLREIEYMLGHDYDERVGSDANGFSDWVTGAVAAAAVLDTATPPDVAGEPTPEVRQPVPETVTNTNTPLSWNGTPVATPALLAAAPNSTVPPGAQ
jgi:hypothetical protein